MEWVLFGVAGLCVVATVHTYLIYPWWVVRTDRLSPTPTRAVPPATGWPLVTVLMAVHNEERVLATKLGTLAAQDYAGELRILVADDYSTDATPDLLHSVPFTNPRHTYEAGTNADRLGKPATINRLARQAGTEGVLVLTDASVMLQPNTITELIRPMLHDAGLGVVDSRMVHPDLGADGIGRSEARYIDREVALKQAEGRVLGYPIGPFGGCWAVRAAAFTPVPDTFLVDDFFICMAAYRAGWRGYSSDRAVVYEAVGQHIAHEFRRKVRIGSGNWQNLVYFSELWWPPQKNALAFGFFSHKVLRWCTPIALLLLTTCLLVLWLLGGNYWAGVLLVTAVGLAVITVVLDGILRRLDLHFAPLRNLHYFLAMNAALLVGFVRYLTGIRTNVWQPSYRPPNDGPPRHPR